MIVSMSEPIERSSKECDHRLRAPEEDEDDDDDDDDKKKIGCNFDEKELPIWEMGRYLFPPFSTHLVFTEEIAEATFSWTTERTSKVGLSPTKD